MTRVTFVAFALLSGFFYITGKPVTPTGQVTNTFTDLVNHRTISDHRSTNNISKHLISHPKSTAISAKSKDIHRRQLAKLEGPTLPIRNPRRTTTPIVKYAKLVPTSASSTPVKTTHIAKVNTTKTFQDGRNKLNGGTIKPLGFSYQQRYVKPQKPVLGPRLTAVLLKRELRRLGCYGGNVTSKWDDSARAAVAFFNSSTGSNLATKTPLVSSLEKVQQITKTVCVEQPIIEGTIIASAGQGKALGKSRGKSGLKTRTIKKTTRWRTNIQYRKASYRPAPTSAPQYNIRRTRTAERYIALPTHLARPRKTSRKYRIKRVKRTRISRRKARRRTAVRSWRKRHRRKRFGFKSFAGSVSLNQ